MWRGCRNASESNMLNRASQPGGPRQIYVPWVCEHQPWGQSAGLALAVPGSPEEILKSGSRTHRTWGTCHSVWCSECGWGGSRSHAHLLQQPLLLVDKRAHRRICAPVTQGHHLQPRYSRLWWWFLASASVGKGSICICPHNICGRYVLQWCPNWLL